MLAATRARGNPADKPPKKLPKGIAMTPTSKPRTKSGCCSFLIMPSPTGMLNTSVAPNVEATRRPAISPALGSAANSMESW